MTERLPMSVRVLLGLGVMIVLAGVMWWQEMGPVVGASVVGLGVLCVVVGAIRWRRVPKPPPHSIHEELQEAYEARVIVGAIGAAVTWCVIIVALFMSGYPTLGATMLAMVILGPLLAYKLATSATRTHRRRSRTRGA